MSRRGSANSGNYSAEEEVYEDDYYSDSQSMGGGESNGNRKGIGATIHSVKEGKRKLVAGAKVVKDSPGGQKTASLFKASGKVQKWRTVLEEAETAELGEAGGSEFVYSAGNDYLGRPIVVIEVSKLILDSPEEIHNSFNLLVRTAHDLITQAKESDVKCIMVVNFCQDIHDRQQTTTTMGILKKLYDIAPGPYFHNVGKIFFIHPPVASKVFFKSAMNRWYKKTVMIHNMWKMFSEINYMQIPFSAQAYRLDLKNKIHKSVRKNLEVPTKDLQDLKAQIEEHLSQNQQLAQSILDNEVQGDRHAPIYMEKRYINHVANGGREDEMNKLFDEFQYQIDSGYPKINMSTRHFTKILLMQAEGSEINYWYDYYQNLNVE